MRVANPHAGCQLFFWLRSLCRSGKLAEGSPWGPSHHGPGLRVPEPAQHPGKALLTGSLPPAGCCQESLQSGGTSPCLRDPSRSSAAAAAGLSRTMQAVWRWPATGRSAWERSCPPRGSACAGQTTQTLHRPALCSLGVPGKSSTDFPSTHHWDGSPLQGCSVTPKNLCGEWFSPCQGVEAAVLGLLGAGRGQALVYGLRGVTIAVGALHRTLGGNK